MLKRSRGRATPAAYGIAGYAPTRRDGILLAGLTILVIAGGVAACRGGGSDGAGTTAGASDDTSPASGAVDDDGAVPTDAGLYGSEDDGDAAPAPLCTLTGAPKVVPGDVLVYSDSFENGAVDQRKWNIGNGYLGHSTIANTASPRDVVVSNGALSIITARNPADSVHPYVSGWLDSLGKFARTYGKIEFRARFPYAAGIWYAIWGRPWTDSYPEIDLEVVNQAEDSHTELFFVNHWAAPAPGVSADDRRSYVMRDDLDVALYHTYTLTWTDTGLEWARDGEVLFQGTPQGVPHEPVFWLINGWAGGWVGNPTADTPLPNTFDVDYMRVYRVDGLIADPEVKIMGTQTSYAKTDMLNVGIANFDEVCAHVQMYDGMTLVQTASALPIQLPLSGLGSGTHAITLVATDGERSTTLNASIEIQ